MPEEDPDAGELDHAEKVLDVIFPARDGAPEVMEPGKEAFDLPAAPTPTEGPPVLRGWAAAAAAMSGDHRDAIALPQERIERVAVVAAVADQSRGELGQEAGVEGRGNEVRLIR